VRRGLLLAGVGLAASVAAAGLIAGSNSDEPAAPFQVRISQPKADCFQGTYLPSWRSGLKVKEEGPPRDWSRIENAAGAMQPSPAAVEVTIRPRQKGEAITLKGISFEVETFSRPLGIAFYRPCKPDVHGAAIEARLDPQPHVIASNADLRGTLRSGPRLPARGHQIHLPWTLSLERPLHLYVLVWSEDGNYLWSARIPWESRSSEGVIHVDDGGRKYRLSQRLITWWERPVDGEWLRTQSPRWTGVR
jgi:hypothetical protein